MLWLERQEQGEPNKSGGDDDGEEGNKDEEEDGESGEEEYDKGVEGGVWVESSGSESQEYNFRARDESGNREEARSANLEIQDSQSDPDCDNVLDTPINVNVNNNDNDNNNNENKNKNGKGEGDGQELSSDSIIPPGPARHPHGAEEASQDLHDDRDENDDSAGNTINVQSESSPRGRRLVRGHRKSGSDEVR